MASHEFKKFSILSLIAKICNKRKKRYSFNKKEKSEELSRCKSALEENLVK